MSSLASLLKHQPVAILDGATGTEVERRGYSISDSKLWSAKYLVKNPQVLKDIHFDYYRAGADICTTATYQASIKGLINEGVSPSDTSNIFKAAANVCADARDLFWTEYCNNVKNDQDSDSLKANFKFPSRHKPLVAYSCGAFGASMSDGSEFTGDYAEHTTVEQLISHHRERLDPIRGHPGIDLLAFETIPCIQEAEAITRLLSTGGYGIPAWVSFSCKDGEHTCHVERIGMQLGIVGRALHLHSLSLPGLLRLLRCGWSQGQQLLVDVVGQPLNTSKS
ncbi:hypothetical protein CEUSTIGMA_g7260.t1 [Chlamydomonas eustigma]|uniref:Hcy-binding domain-containing protein n=1 Tax=Chlamydomonas eustigma TaxID=1157962 RepID=A0A250XAN0_9CHLO|nr:hypothetical protein CEUSTIGMA_g7260.t1 [Chlamydomonas eustigma]|eukprot:GAX79820.1 hypothetical protein CEUSTIGMA_g7260.t1 [Chlamydomonas eustigma]